jgi:hypothetical protein
MILVLHHLQLVATRLNSYRTLANGTPIALSLDDNVDGNPHGKDKRPAG